MNQKAPSETCKKGQPIITLVPGAECELGLVVTGLKGLEKRVQGTGGADGHNQSWGKREI